MNKLPAGTKSWVIPSAGEFRDVNGVAEGTGVNVGWIVGEGAVGVLVLSMTVAVAVTVEVDSGGACCGVHAERITEMERMKRNVFFIAGYWINAIAISAS